MWSRLLLVPLLLFGFTAMHTLGHPADSGHGSNHHAVASAAPAEHNAAPWIGDTHGEDLPDLDPTDACEPLTGPGTAKPGAATTVTTQWPQGPPLRPARVPVPAHAAPEAGGALSLAELQVLRV